MHHIWNAIYIYILADMVFHTYGNKNSLNLLLLPGLGVSYEIFKPLIQRLKDIFYIIAVEPDGFILGTYSEFTSIDNQAQQVIGYIKEHLDGSLDYAYGLSMGGKILSRIMEKDEVTVNHAILDGAPLLSLPKWLVGPLRYYQCINVWTCYHWSGFWKRLLPSHYFGTLLDECRKIWPYGKCKAVLDGYKDIYSNTLASIKGEDIHYWYGSKESYVAKPQVNHLMKLNPHTRIEIFKEMNHGQLLIDRPEEVALRILQLKSKSEEKSQQQKF